MKRVLGILIAAIMVIAAVPGAGMPAYADGGIHVSANIGGAEIYVNGGFSGASTEQGGAGATLEAAPGDVIKIVLPGYKAETQTVRSGVSSYAFLLEPELYPAEYADEGKNITIKVGSGGDYLYLSDALCHAAYDISDDIWCVFELCDGAVTYCDEEIFRIRNHYTICGEAGGTAVDFGINPYGVDGLRLFNLDFTNRSDQTQFTIRSSQGHSIVPAVNTENIYVCGCKFMDPSEMGIYQCVEYGCGGTAYGSDGTFNIKNLNIINNELRADEYSGRTTELFNFAAAGDGDYNVVDGYTVMANKVDGNIGFITADAHSWYVYARTAIDSGSWESSGNMEAGQIGYCDHNVMRNILVSGNTVNNGTIQIQTANLGNQYNLMEKVLIRNNNVFNDHTGTGQWAGGLSITTVSVADNYEDDRYHVEPGFTHTDNNTMTDVQVYGNHFESGMGREVYVRNVSTNVGEQHGDHNTLSKISIHDNDFITRAGIKICNYGDGITMASHLRCEDNNTSDISFENNTVTAPHDLDQINEPGILAAGSYLSKHGEQFNGPAPSFGSMKNISISGNIIAGYTTGIAGAGCYGDYQSGNSLEGLIILNNTIRNENRHEYAICDTGILLAGSAGQTYSHEYTPDCVNQNGSLSDVTVSGNDIVARAGILAGGLVVTNGLDKRSSGNTVRDITIENNSIEQRAQQPEFVNMGDPQSVSAGVLVSAVISFNDNLKTGGSSDSYELTSGNSVTGVSVGTNNISAAFKPAVVNVLSSGTVDSSWTSEKKGDMYYAEKTFGACTAYQEVSQDEIVEPPGGGSGGDPSDGGSGTDPSGSGSGTEVDTRAANTLSVSGKTASVKYSKLKKRSQTLPVSKVIKFRRKGQGTRTYALISAKKGSKSYKTKFRINAKSGKVTVKKGLKKGTYKVRVRITASGNDSRKPASKTVTFKVRVK